MAVVLASSCFGDYWSDRRGGAPSMDDRLAREVFYERGLRFEEQILKAGAGRVRIEVRKILGPNALGLSTDFSSGRIDGIVGFTRAT